MASLNLSPVVPFPALTDPSEYENLSEYERMTKGMPFRLLDTELTAKRLRAREICQRYNETAVADEIGRRELLDELLHPDCKGKNIRIKPPFHIDHGYHLKVGQNFFANNDCYILDYNTIEFGDDCKLAPGVHLYTFTHPLNGACRKRDDKDNYFEFAKPIKVGDNCWLGGKSIICPGVTLGNNVVVGAGAVVTKSFPDNVVLAGNPAKVIRHMPPPEAPPFSINI